MAIRSSMLCAWTADMRRNAMMEIKVLCLMVMCIALGMVGDETVRMIMRWRKDA